MNQARYPIYSGSQLDVNVALRVGAPHIDATYALVHREIVQSIRASGVQPTLLSIYVALYTEEPP